MCLNYDLNMTTDGKKRLPKLWILEDRIEHAALAMVNVPGAQQILNEVPTELAI